MESIEALDNREWDRAFFAAMQNCHRQAMRRLIEDDVGVDLAVNNRWERAIILAAKDGSIAVMSYLLKTAPKNYININAVDSNGDTALLHAARRGRGELMKSLLDYQPKDIDIEVTNNAGESALSIAQRYACYIPALPRSKQNRNLLRKALKYQQRLKRWRKVRKQLVSVKDSIKQQLNPVSLFLWCSMFFRIPGVGEKELERSIKYLSDRAAGPKI